MLTSGACDEGGAGGVEVGVRARARGGVRRCRATTTAATEGSRGRAEGDGRARGDRRAMAAATVERAGFGGSGRVGKDEPRG